MTRFWNILGMIGMVVAATLMFGFTAMMLLRAFG